MLKLYAQPAARLTALLAVGSVSDALDLLELARQRCDASLTGFELMSDVCLQLVQTHFPEQRTPFASRHPQYVLMELSDCESESHVMAMLEAVSESGIERGLIADAVIASSFSQSQRLWALREHISMAQAAEGLNIKHDISLPVSAIPAFVAETDGLLQREFPGCRMVSFGHLGDGNLHYNVSAPEGVSHEAFLQQQDAINRSEEHTSELQSH